MTTRREATREIGACHTAGKHVTWIARRFRGGTDVRSGVEVTARRCER